MGRPRILDPFGIRDFALLWGGMTISLLGDGIYLVAIAWQAYELSNAPYALSLVGLAWTAPQVVLFLVGGAIGDRFERRRVLIFADLVRGAAVAGIGVLAVTGALQLWHLVALVGVYGVGSVFFGPAFSALVPEIVPPQQLVQANALDSLVRPLTARVAGPAIGGWTIAVGGAGAAFLVNAASFGASILALLLLQTRSVPDRVRRAVLSDVREGLAYVRDQTWLGGTLLAVALGMVFFLGPVYVLVPYVVKNGLDAGADGLGLVFAAGGAGAMLASLTIGQRGMPRRPFTLVYFAWAASSFALVGYGVATELWHAVVVSFVSVSFLTLGGILWATTLQRMVPNRLLGRVSSIDLLLSFGLAPVSYALTGLFADLIGAERTLIQAGIVSGGILVAAYVLLPELRALDRRSDSARPYAA